MPATSDRQYARTHPWITFRVDLHTLAHKTWMLLGEAESKCEHVAGVPLRPATADRLNGIYLSKGIRGTPLATRVDGWLTPPGQGGRPGAQATGLT
jgi:hypothetical protein